jgi:hypothetical protein
MLEDDLLLNTFKAKSCCATTKLWNRVKSYCLSLIAFVFACNCFAVDIFSHVVKRSHKTNTYHAFDYKVT